MEVVFAEILSPVTDAVDFVYHEAVDFVPLIELVESGHEPGRLDQLFWGQVHYFVFDAFDLAVELAYLLVLSLGIAYAQ